MTSLRDYAREAGVSYEAIRQQVKRYHKELAGHIHQDGRTQFLDDFAITFLNKKRARNPLVVYEKDKSQRMEELEEENKELWKALNGAKDRIIELQGAQLKLEAAEKETKLLEGFVADAKAEIKALTEEKAAEVAAARQEASKATEARWRSMSVWEFLRERKKGE